MRLTYRQISIWHAVPVSLALLLIFTLLRANRANAQHGAVPAVAQVGASSPLPVYVVNDPRPVLPDGFVPGSSWKFTTWTTPSTLTFTATVQKTEGGWAFLAVNGNGGGGTRWYYIPQMPGAWEAQ
jgi:hypothetical protein